MTSVAAPVRARTATRTPPARRGGTRTRARDEALRPGRVAARPASGERTRAQEGSERQRGQTVGRVGAILVVATIAALILAVVFHVVLAQRQMELDRMNVEIAKEQNAYEKNRLLESLLSSPPRIIQEGERLGLALPAEPPLYLTVPGAPLPSAETGEPSTTIDEYGKVKAELADEQP